MNKKELRYAFNEVLNAAENMRCENLHHAKKHQHKIDEMCPVEYNIQRQAYIVREYMSYEAWGEPDEIPECQNCKDSAKDYAELDKIAGDLAVLVVRLSRALRKASPDNDLPTTAMDYLQRNDFDCEPLRKVSNALVKGAQNDTERRAEL